MGNFLIKNKNIYLKLLTPESNLDNYHSWVNDEDTNRYLNKKPFQTIDDLKRYINYHLDLNNYLCGIYKIDTNTHVGNTLLSHIDLINNNCTVGILVGKEYWGKGMGTSAVSLISDYALNTLGFHKIIAGVVKENIGSSKLFERSGFILEGIRREEFKLDNKFLDTLYYGKINNT
jgi:ribosomal-protein-alanine N-acetyltransferase